MNLYHVTKFSPCFPFTVYCFYTKISSFMPVFSTRIVLDCFYLLIFYSEKFSTDVCRLPYAVNVNLSIIARGRCVSGHAATSPKCFDQEGLGRRTGIRQVLKLKLCHMIETKTTRRQQGSKDAVNILTQLVMLTRGKIFIACKESNFSKEQG